MKFTAIFALVAAASAVSLNNPHHKHAHGHGHHKVAHTEEKDQH
mgnify:CR=1 FL=1